jgi:hypothetical protein
VHHLDTTLYSNYLYGYCADAAEVSQNLAGSLFPDKDGNGAYPITYTPDTLFCDLDTNKESNGREVMLCSTTKLAQVNITFSWFKSILRRWFDS